MIALWQVDGNRLTAVVDPRWHGHIFVSAAMVLMTFLACVPSSTSFRQKSQTQMLISVRKMIKQNNDESDDHENDDHNDYDYGDDGDEEHDER